MLTTRIIGVINVLNGVAVQSINFDKYLPIGDPQICVNYLNKWGIDEIIILDIKGHLNREFQLHKKLPKYVLECQAPISSGGGIKNLNDIENLIRNGSDKVIINSSIHSNPKIIYDGAKEFGNQAIIVSIDVRKINGSYEAFTHSGSKRIEMPLQDIITMTQDNGAGEIMINSIDRDGSKLGYDLSLFDFISINSNIPIIGCGGVGSSIHFLKALDLNLSGLAAGNFFHYTEHSVNILKSYLVHHKKNIRLETYADYKKVNFGLDERVLPYEDEKLEALKYNYIPQEKI